MRKNTEAIVNIYELDENWEEFRVLSFEEENEKWLEFVCACRKGENINSDYDIIIGNAAGDEDIGLVGGRESFGGIISHVNFIYNLRATCGYN